MLATMAMTPVSGMIRNVRSNCADATRLNASATRKKFNTATLNTCRTRCRSIPPGLKNLHTYPAAIIKPNSHRTLLIPHPAVFFILPPVPGRMNSFIDILPVFQRGNQHKFSVLACGHATAISPLTKYPGLIIMHGRFQSTSAKNILVGWR